MKITDKGFFELPVQALAQILLGKILVRRTNDSRILRFRITETEAYGGMDDTASHASRGATKRNAPMFERGGTVYVYLCYGIHNVLNIISGIQGKPEGVMIRGVMEINAKGTAPRLAIGPGLVCRALEITRDLNTENLAISKNLWLESDNFCIKDTDIQKLPRVGIGYASKNDQEKPWRFKLKCD